MTDYFARIPSETKLVVNTSRPEGPIIHHEDCSYLQYEVAGYDPNVPAVLCLRCMISTKAPS